MQRLFNNLVNSANPLKKKKATHLLFPFSTRWGGMDENSQPVAVLVRTDGAPKTVPPLIVFSSVNSSVSVGRAENNQIPLNDKKISKNHALLTLRSCKRKGAQDGEAGGVRAGAGVQAVIFLGQTLICFSFDTLCDFTRQVMRRVFIKDSSTFGTFALVRGGCRS